MKTGETPTVVGRAATSYTVIAKYGDGPETVPDQTPVVMPSPEHQFLNQCFHPKLHPSAFGT